ncbi:hypothetical protein [Bdellovibrio svalbardensis]|uniref:Uncharacterized protein n=1 Tax=Bdellovibrio svalbardensis TaxID=2972972 RepID=A0ABT6DHS0_9BACT|nr:hypothetical protein [Bdellovibrio svalbardensis]MDG0816372.1 hypothetical protein [Bdellovibrio svalbardensis]
MMKTPSCLHLLLAKDVLNGSENTDAKNKKTADFSCGFLLVFDFAEN